MAGNVTHRPTNTGCHAIFRQFLADGLTTIFGNPGTVEQGFLDALADFPEMTYILTLQESVALLCADGYARATQKPTVVQLHSSPGIGNGVGALYQAKRGHAPLVVIGGDAGIGYMNMDAQMAADLVAMMEPVTKYATMVLDPRSLLRTLRRAIKIAATPPMGPVYICLPADVMDAVNTETVVPTSLPSTRVRPGDDDIEAAAAMLAGAQRPKIVIGDGVAWSGATSALERLALQIGAEVWIAGGGDLNIATTHPCLMGSTGHMFGSQSLPIFQSADAVLVLGCYLLPEVFPHLGDLFDPAAKVIHFDLNAYEIAKNHRVDLGVVCNPRCALEALEPVLARTMDEGARTRAADRVAAFTARKVEETAAAAKTDAARAAQPHATMEAFAAELAKRMPSDTLVFDESLTSSMPFNRAIPRTEPGSYFFTRGGSLGVGFPGAVGVQMAHPDKLVVGLSGDGGTMYTLQVLYTAKKYNSRTLFVVCNNTRYKLLDLNIEHYWQEHGYTEHALPPSFDLSDPPLGFVEMAKGMGVPGIRITQSAEIPAALDQALATDGPFLIDLVLTEHTEDHTPGCTCGQ
ncbi:thiamine pyrophosphate-binding protein [Roseospira marina]|uniref:Thiamine pyrophosphate-binding protein n=1 Tax=Roseospira marina TaxID=140057 RepID=A0A5M6I7J0_9PROT|nr:thiamine pyrophosphate-binding protein [Roseospira marina]KAA5604092.1 thiamine pyrophosphate-binding protein [Roseospira marina]MBB4315809.1 benzoylformate decarboxylase [Roseospira marina]MBB5088952.1 benzoylformate decarboxylase [Roseospira marina]